jgi:hypothetical protein
VFRVVWRVTWTSTDGTSGNFGFLVTATATAFQVNEVQTIGDG